MSSNQDRIIRSPDAPALLSLSGDGHQLAVVTAKGETDPLYGLPTQGGEMRYYSLDAQTRIPNPVRTEAIEGQSLVNSAEWDVDNLTLVYATMDVVNGYQLHRNTGFTYSEALNKPVTLARGANNELFVNHSGAADLYLLGDNQLLPTTTGLAGYAFTGTMPQQSHFVEDKNPVEINLYTRALGNKRYELTDHLGNVRATVSDQLKLNGANYEAGLQSTATYYPFGMTIGSLSYGSEGYRFGFQGQEKDDEVYGSSGSFLNFKYRGYGRFLSVDPLMAKYPWNSPYNFSENRVIDGIELEGLEFKNASQAFNYYWSKKSGYYYSGSDEEFLKNKSKHLVRTTANEIRQTAESTMRSPLMMGLTALMALPVIAEVAPLASLSIEATSIEALPHIARGILSINGEVGLAVDAVGGFIASNPNVAGALVEGIITAAAPLGTDIDNSYQGPYNYLTRTMVSIYANKEELTGEGVKALESFGSLLQATLDYKTNYKYDEDYSMPVDNTSIRGIANEELINDNYMKKNSNKNEE
jgi:hypothetical protein